MNREQIATLVPHAGAMVLLDRVDVLTDTTITCAATSHRLADHPLRRNGGFSCVHAIEYAAQAAAVHGALQGSGSPASGYLGSVRDVELFTDRLDVPGDLTIAAELLMRDPRGAIYRFEARSETMVLARGRFTIVFIRSP
jgi:predicted hotdog family 3-hydroxylacyl-ACP dehydratase